MVGQDGEKGQNGHKGHDGKILKFGVYGNMVRFCKGSQIGPKRNNFKY